MEGECNLRGQTCHSCKLAPRDQKRKILNSSWVTSWRPSILENPKLAPGEYGEDDCDDYLVIFAARMAGR